MSGADRGDQGGDEGRGAAPRIAVVGNTVVDVIVRGGNGLRAPGRDGWGEATHLVTEPVEVLLGGCGAAPAYVLGRLGASPALVTNMAADAWGGLVARWLVGAGVRIADPREPAAATAVHIVHVDDDGSRRSVYYTGAKVPWRACLNHLDAPRAGSSGLETPWLETPCLDGPWLLASGYGGVGAEDGPVLAEVFAAARARGARVAFDPGPWFGRCAGPGDMLGLWRDVDLLTATAEEIAPWLPERGSAPQGGGYNSIGLADLALAACEAGPAIAVVKGGPRGAGYACRSGEAGTVETEPVPGASSVGAGDSFDARLIWGLATGEEIAAAVGAAVELATRVVRRGRGALGALDTED